MNSKKLILLGSVLIVGYLAFHFGYPMIAGKEGGMAGAPGGPPGGFPPTAVEAYEVKMVPLAETALAVGTLQADESVVLRPEISGRVSDISFAEGAPIKMGSIVVSLDDSLLRAQLLEAQAKHELTRNQFERAETLFQKGTGSASMRDDARSRLRADEASVKLAEASLAKTKLRAPFDGVAGVRNVSVGDYVSPGQDIVGITKLDPLKVDFRVPETLLGNIGVGQKVLITTTALPGRTFEGDVYAIDPQIDEQTRSITLRAHLPNPDYTLRPGIFAQVRLDIGAAPETLAIPEQSLIPLGAEQAVYKIVDGKAVMAKVKTGYRNQGMVQITEGLASGDVVITAGQMKVREGAPVNPSLQAATVAPVVDAPVEKKADDGMAGLPPPPGDAPAEKDVKPAAPAN